MFKGKKVKMGLFTGPTLPDTNFWNGIRLLFASEFASFVNPDADLILWGLYEVVESEDTAADDPDYKLEVIRITASINTTKGKNLVNFSVEVNSTDDIIYVRGDTVAPPLHGTQKQRNQAASKAHAHPSFQLIESTRVGPTNHDKHPFSVEILVKDKADGTATPIAPKNKSGRAFVDIKPSQFYKIRLHNNADFEAAAEVTIDGLDVIKTFCKDNKKPSRFLVPAKGSTTIRGWLHTTKPKAPDSLLSFLVTELGRGAATRLKSTGEVGVITGLRRRVGGRQGTADRREGRLAPAVARPTPARPCGRKSWSSNASSGTAAFHREHPPQPDG